MNNLRSVTTKAGFLGAAGMMGAAFVLTLVAAKLGRFTPFVFMYHALVWAAFLGMYLSLPGGFKAHFNVPDSKKDMKSADIAYYCLVTHAGVGYGDIYPVTTGARMLVSCHIFLAMLAIFNMVPLGKTTVSYGGYETGP